MPAPVFRIGETVVHTTPAGLSTTLADGTLVHAEPAGTPEQAEMARDLGYGDDVLAMTRDHDLVHAVLAELLGLSASPALADAPYPERWGSALANLDEATTLAFQRYALAAGVDLQARLAALYP